MRSRNWILLLTLFLGASSWSCASDQLNGQPFQNQPPSVWLSAAPPEGTTADYTLHLYWGGWDPDGEIDFYEYVITNNDSGIFDPADTTSTPGDYKWRRVFANDSTFRFTADLVADSLAFRDNRHEPEEFIRSHTFFVRAVDQDGLRSVKPAYRSFTSRTLSPVVDVTVPPRTRFNPAQLPPITKFQWRAVDYVSNELQIQDPDSVRWIVVPTSKFGGSWEETTRYVQTSPNAPEWSSWHFYRAPQDSGKFWNSSPLEFGPYIFAVQVMDEAGAVNPVFDLDRNLRRIIVSTRSTGPIFTVRNEYMGNIVTSNPNTAPTILDLPAGLPMTFEFWADASSYGGIVSGYRYGWDIFDLNDPEQWEIDYTPFVGTIARSPSRRFFFGSHTFHVEVIDNSGFKSRVAVTVNIVPFTMQRPLLVVDDWQEGSAGGWVKSNGALPSDIEHDAFWRDMLSEVDGFLPSVDVFAVGPGVPTVPIQVVANYKNIIWNSSASHTGGGSAVVSEMVRFKDPRETATSGKSQPNIPALFMRAGGHVLLCGQEFMTMTINRRSFQGLTLVFPIIFRYELTGDQDGAYQDSEVGTRGVGDESFAYNDCCLNVLDIAYISNSNAVRRPPGQRKPPGTGCPVNLIRQHNGLADGLRAASPVDVTTGSEFPRLELRPEVSAPGRFHERIGLNCDIYNPVYFSELTACASVNEITPPRECFQPMYAIECANTNSVIFGATVGFWTAVYGNRTPDSGGGVAARSVVWGFQPVYMKPAQVKAALAIILHDEWKIPRIPPPEVISGNETSR